MNEKTFSRLVVLCLVMAMLATAVLSTTTVSEQEFSAGDLTNFTSFVDNGREAPAPLPDAISCGGCSGGDDGPG